MLALHLKTGIKLKVLRRNAISYALLGAVGIAGFNGALFVSLQSTDPVTAALIMATSPLWTNLLETILKGRFPTPLYVCGVIVSLIGVAMVITNGTFSKGSNIAFAPGDFTIALGSLAWAVYTVGCRNFVTESSPLETATWTMISRASTLVVVAFVNEHPIRAIANGTLNAHFAVVYMAIAGSVLAYVFWVNAVSVRGPGPTSSFLNLEPVFAFLISIAQGTNPGEIQILGIGLTILGILITP